MSKKICIVISFLLYLWQLPQNLIGLIFSWLCSPVKHTFNLGKHRWTEAQLNYTSWMDIGGKFHSGVCLGKYIFLCEHRNDYDLTAERHEYGHYRQSMILGPLYLFVIGIPSLIHAAFWKPGKKGYYDFYTERLADKLGKVERI